MMRSKIERLRCKGRKLMEKYICGVGIGRRIMPRYVNKNVYLKSSVRFLDKCITNYIMQLSIMWIGYKYGIYIDTLIYITSCYILALCVLKICQKKIRPDYDLSNEKSMRMHNRWWRQWFWKNLILSRICYVIYNYIHIGTIGHVIKLICIYIMRKINSVFQYLKWESKKKNSLKLICKMEIIWVLFIKGMYGVGEDIIEFTIKYILMIYYKEKVKIYSENIWRLLRGRIMIFMYGVVFLKYTLGIISIIYIYKLFENLIRKWVNGNGDFIKSMLYELNDYSLLYYYYVANLVMRYKKASSLFMYNAVYNAPINLFQSEEGFRELNRLPMGFDAYKNINLLMIDVVDIYKQKKEEMFKDVSGKCTLPVLYKIKLEEIINKSINLFMVGGQCGDELLQEAEDSVAREAIEAYFTRNRLIFEAWIDLIEMMVGSAKQECLYLRITFRKNYGFIVHIVIDNEEINKLKIFGGGWLRRERKLNWIFSACAAQLMIEKRLGYDMSKMYRRIGTQNRYDAEVLTGCEIRLINVIRDRLPVREYDVDSG